MSGYWNLLFQTGIYRLEWKSVYYNLALLIRTVYKKSPLVWGLFLPSTNNELSSLIICLFWREIVRIFLWSFEFFRVNYVMDEESVVLASGVFRLFFGNPSGNLGVFIGGLPKTPEELEVVPKPSRSRPEAVPKESRRNHEEIPKRSRSRQYQNKAETWGTYQIRQNQFRANQPPTANLQPSTVNHQPSTANHQPFLITGATRVPNNSMECIIWACGMVPTLT